MMLVNVADVGTDAVCCTDGPVSLQCRSTWGLVRPIQRPALVPRLCR